MRVQPSVTIGVALTAGDYVLSRLLGYVALETVLVALVFGRKHLFPSRDANTSAEPGTA